MVISNRVVSMVQQISPEHFDRTMGLVLDRLTAMGDQSPQAIEGAVRRGIESGIHAALTDPKLLASFWRGGYEELTKHANTGASQWIGKRILTVLATAALALSITWLVKTGKL